MVDPWRSNVRELEAVIEEAMIVRRPVWIAPDDLTFDMPPAEDAVARGGVVRAAEMSRHQIAI